MLTVYKHADDFLKENKHLLVPRQLELNIMWLNAHSGKSVSEGHYSAKAENDTSVVLAVQTAPYPFGIATFGDDCEELLKEIYNHAKDNTDINTCNGLLDDITSFAKANNRDYNVVETYTYIS